MRSHGQAVLAVCLLSSCSLIGLGPKKSNTTVDITVPPENAFLVKNERCRLGALVVSSTTSSLLCLPYSPNRAVELCVKEWKDPSHEAVINIMDSSAGTLEERITKAGQQIPNALGRGGRGEMALVRAAAGLEVKTPSTLAAGMKAQAVNITLQIVVGSMSLTDSQRRCLQAQSKEDTVKQSNGYAPIGFIDQVDVGFANYISLRGVTVQLNAGSSVTVNAEDYQVGAATLGGIAPEYTQKINEIIGSSPTGERAAEISNELTTWHDKVTRAVSVVAYFLPVPK
jgi:hypothetical protein